MRSGEILGDRSQSQALLICAHHPFPTGNLSEKDSHSWKHLPWLGVCVSWYWWAFGLLIHTSPSLGLHDSFFSGMTLTYSKFRDLLSLCKLLLHLALVFWWRKLSLPQHCWSRCVVQSAQSRGWGGGSAGGSVQARMKDPETMLVLFSILYLSN